MICCFFFNSSEQRTGNGLIRSQSAWTSVFLSCISWLTQHTIYSMQISHTRTERAYQPETFVRSQNPRRCEKRLWTICRGTREIREGKSALRCSAGKYIWGGERGRERGGVAFLSCCHRAVTVSVRTHPSRLWHVGCTFAWSSSLLFIQPSSRRTN